MKSQSNWKEQEKEKQDKNKKRIGGRMFGLRAVQFQRSSCEPSNKNVLQNIYFYFSSQFFPHPRSRCFWVWK